MKKERKERGKEKKKEGKNTNGECVLLSNRVA
jgi:hypothetical protein